MIASQLQGKPSRIENTPPPPRVPGCVCYLDEIDPDELRCGGSHVLLERIAQHCRGLCHLRWSEEHESERAGEPESGRERERSQGYSARTGELTSTENISHCTNHWRKSLDTSASFESLSPSPSPSLPPSPTLLAGVRERDAPQNATWRCSTSQLTVQGTQVVVVDWLRYPYSLTHSTAADLTNPPA